MTAAIVSAAPSGGEALLQSDARRVSNVHRGQTPRDGDEGHFQSEDTPNRARKGDANTSDAHVDKAEKVSKQRQGKGKSDDDSFEETFDSIGQDKVKDAGAKSDQAAVNFPDLTLVNIVADNALGGKSDTTGAGANAKQSALRPASLLPQKSILALMDAKDRLFANADQPIAVGASDKAGDGENTIQSDTAEIVPMALNRRETHWNFNSEAMANASSQLSALQSGDGNLSRAVILQGATPALKEQALESNSSTNAAHLSAPTAVATSGADQTMNPSFANGGNGDQSGAQPQGQSVATAPTDRKSVKAAASSPLEQIFAPSSNAQPSASAVTTQVRDGVIDGLSTVSADRSSGPSTIDLPTRPRSAPMLRTLDLTLSPADLGSVRLRMSLSSNTLSIEAEATKASTAKLLNDDRQNLERGLKDAGYDISSVKITETSASTSTNANGWQTNGSPQRDGDQQRSAFMGGQGGGMQGRDGSPSDQAQRRQREPNQQAAQADVAAGRLGNAVYI